MSASCELAERSAISIVQRDGNILICARGDLPSPGFDVRIEQSPLRIFPPQFNIVRCRRPGVFPQVITPYRLCRSFPLGDQVAEITVHHAEGRDQVAVEPCKDGYGGYEDSCRYGDDAQGGIAGFHELFVKIRADIDGLF